LRPQHQLITVALKKYVFTYLLLLPLLFLLSCGTEEKNVESDTKVKESGDLEDILKKGKLTILAENSSTSYFIYRGKKMGFEYELLKEFADDLGVELEVKVVHDLDKLTELLNNKEGDLITCNYTYTKDRLDLINFSEPYFITPQVLIQRKPVNSAKMGYEELNNQMVRSPEQLAKKKIHVWKNSSYQQRLLNLQEEIGDTIYIEEQNGQIGTEEMIEMVSEGMIDYTVTEQNVAQANEKFYENIDIQTVLSVKQKICFGLRKSCPLLKARLDKWLTGFMKKAAFRYLKRKYFELGASSAMTAAPTRKLRKGELSPFDDIFKREAAKYSWDWTLLASMAYQESRFNPTVVGYGGAYSMMQFMPTVGPKYGVYPDSPPEVQIAGGMKLINKYYVKWGKIADQEQRIKFSLASYNAGLGHVEDAVRLAKKHGKDPEKWDDNVEVMMLNLSKQNYYRDPVVKNGAHRGGITFKYVRGIYTRYQEWKSVFK
jgi:membrane-bound lytic murein transglycosylase F